jgi:hypothetical protein
VKIHIYRQTFHGIERVGNKSYTLAEFKELQRMDPLLMAEANEILLAKRFKTVLASFLLTSFILFVLMKITA